MDHVSAEKRSAIMAAVKSRGSGPEMRIRRILHAAGYRYSLHRADLPGTPDLVFSSRHKAIFVHGCFWHRHGCRLTTSPKTRAAFWDAKFAANQVRDRRNRRALSKLGWKSLIVWQCQLMRPAIAFARVQRFLESA